VNWQVSSGKVKDQDTDLMLEGLIDLCRKFTDKKSVKGKMQRAALLVLKLSGIYKMYLSHLKMTRGEFKNKLFSFMQGEMNSKQLSKLYQTRNGIKKLGGARKAALVLLSSEDDNGESISGYKFHSLQSHWENWFKGRGRNKNLNKKYQNLNAPYQRMISARDPRVIKLIYNCSDDTSAKVSKLLLKDPEYRAKFPKVIP